eukprot:scaffold2748_cov193-Alexandrium_tamarense.AAC.23
MMRTRRRRYWTTAIVSRGCTQRQRVVLKGLAVVWKGEQQWSCVRRVGENKSGWCWTAVCLSPP